MRNLHDRRIPGWVIENYYRYFFVLMLLMLGARVTVNAMVFHYDAATDTAMPSMLRAMASDMMAAAVLAALACWLRNRLWLGIFFLLFTLTLAGNVLHIMYNNSNLNIGHATQLLEGEFVHGIVLSKQMAYSVAICSAGLFALLYWTWRLPVSHNVKPMGILVASLCIALAGIPRDITRPGWLQQSLWEENLSSPKLLFAWAVKQQYAEEAERYYEGMTMLDLNGTLILPDTRQSKPNILIVTIEGLSNSHLDRGYMPYLKSLSESGIYYPNFIYPSQYTSQGLYSILCGDYSNFKYARERGKIDKISYAIKNSAKMHCMPSYLHAMGYHTAFFQASDPRYSRKDQFMPAIGFNQILGEEPLGKLVGRMKEEDIHGWGMTDKLFFDAALLQLREYEQKNAPWFVTMMTTGTHEPYGVRKEDIEQYGSAEAAAYHRADDALRMLVESLRGEGILQHTLLIVTGDESRLRIHTDIISRLPSAHWGTMVVVTPENTQALQSGYYMQPDIMAGIFDYLRMKTSHLGFRSIFRTYDTYRPILLTGMFTRRTIMLTHKQLSICDLSFSDCTSYGFDGNLFEDELTQIPPDSQLSLYSELPFISSRRLR